MSPFTPIDVTYVSQTTPVVDAPWLNLVNRFSNDAQTQGDGAKGPCAIPFDPAVAYTVTQSLGQFAKDSWVNGLSMITSDTERAAILDYTSTTDVTTRVNAALAMGKRVYLPAGVWNVDPAVGLLLPIGGSLVGDGMMRTILKAASNGGSVAELIAYTQGSIIKRAFTTGIAQAYVTGCYVADLSVQLYHPAYNAANYKQIGIDLRNITRSVVERVHVGNYGLPGQPICPTPTAADACQGYGVIFGTLSSGDVAYAGGEGNILKDSFIAGCYRAVVVDDDVITPLSGAHATLVQGMEIQGAHELCVQKLPYATGVVFRDVTCQNLIRQTGNVDPTIGMQISGYGSSANLRYAEMGASADIIFNFAAGSRQNYALIQGFSFTGVSTGLITDSSPGNNNYLRYPLAVAGSGVGTTAEWNSGAPLACYYKGSWSGATETVDRASGMTLTRTGTGDYTIHLTAAMPNDDWTCSVILDTDGSNHGGMVAFQVSTQTVSALRIFTYSQSAGTSTVIDPVKMLIRVDQSI